MRTSLLGFLLLFLVSSISLSAQTSTAEESFAARFTSNNYQWPFDNDWIGEEFSSGLEFEYIRHFGKVVGLGVPFRIAKVQLPTDERGNFRQAGMISGDLLLHLFPIGHGRVFYPDVFAGIGAGVNRVDDFSGAIPVGLGLNLRIAENTYISAKGEYRFGFDDLRDNLQVGVGLLLNLGEFVPKPPPPVDSDGDGIFDPEDLCPTVPGLAAFNGCPDTDGDGITDGDDGCPTEAGTREMNGCPDTDGDGIADPDDDCPEEAGIAELKGCPERDADGDGVLDKDDACPNEAGTAATNGCPDKDGDGIADANDLCPDTAGPAANRGCPDTDGDGVLDKDDACITTPGPATNRGCPELKIEDKETIEFAIQNVNFRTGSSDLTASSKDVLDRIVDIMNRYPDYKLRIGGHTDSVGSAENNQSLSERRAKSTYEYLMSKGVSPNRMSHAGYGETQPIADNINKAGRERNRRVEFDLYIE